ncbi:MAG: ATPase, T2SS/T4P/T4SS family [Bacillota bacterium]
MKEYLHEIDIIKRHIGINMLCRHIEKSFEEFINKKPENDQEDAVIRLLKQYKESSTSGNREARNIIKSHIKTGLLTAFTIYKTDEEDNIVETVLYEGVKLEEAYGLIDSIIPFNQPELLSAEEKFSILLHVNKQIEANGRDGAFGRLLQKYPIYEKHRITEDYESKRYEYDETDIYGIFKSEKIEISFNDKLEIIVQKIYEKLFGLMCLDVLAYADVNEVGFSNNGEYIYCWCDKKIWLSFLRMDEQEARVVQDRAISFDKSVGQLDRNNPERLCHRADGARITVTQPPYFSARNLCIRIFNKSGAAYRELEHSRKLRVITTALVKAGESICIQGALGTGKTTKMEAMFEILDDALHIGTIEDYFEQQIMRKYPQKRIVEAQAVNNKSLMDAVKTLLRMSVDVADLGEVRDGNALFAFIQLVQSVSVSAWFTTHIVNPDTTVPRLKNMLMGTGRYLTEQSAVMDIVNYINIIFQHENINGSRVISKIVEIVPVSLYSSSDCRQIDDIKDYAEVQRLFYLQQIKSYPSNMYRLNTIFDASDGNARFVNYPSDRMMAKVKGNQEAKAYMDRLIKEIDEDIKNGNGRDDI